MIETEILIRYLLYGGIYFIPAILAYAQHHKQKQAILILNLFLGWTFVGWVVALIWLAIKGKK